MRARGKRRGSKPLKRPTAPLTPPPTWREAVRRPSFRAAALRQAVTVLGVLILGWPALEVALFFLLDAWVYLTVRAGCEITFDPRYGSPDASAWDLVKHTTVAAVVLALLVGLVGFMTIGVSVAGDEWSARGGLGSPLFLVSVLILLLSHLWEGVRFLERLRTRTSEERNQDTLAIRVVVARMFVVAAAPMALGLASAFGQGGRLLVLMISGAILWLEAFPERANLLLGYKPGREYA